MRFVVYYQRLLGTKKTYYLCTLQVADQICRVYPNGWIIISGWKAYTLDLGPPFPRGLPRQIAQDDMTFCGNRESQAKPTHLWLLVAARVDPRLAGKSPC